MPVNSRCDLIQRLKCWNY